MLKHRLQQAQRHIAVIFETWASLADELIAERREAAKYR
jgi:hypothetical protein